MWPNPQETADLVTFTEKPLMENFIFCAVAKTVCPGYTTFYELRKCYIDEKWRNVSSFADEYLASMDAIFNVYDITPVYFVSILFLHKIIYQRKGWQDFLSLRLIICC